MLSGEVLIQFFGDNTPFTLITAGYNGYNASCVLTTLYGCSYQPSIATSASYNRTFSTISSAIYEAGYSRLVGGIHFNFSNIQGIQWFVLYILPYWMWDHCVITPTAY